MKDRNWAKVLLLPAVLAYPSEHWKRQSSAANSSQATSMAEGNCGPTPCIVFDATSQYVSTTGQYAYQSPAASDIRGPCPALNAAANHGYIPRNGTVSISQAISGLGQAFGMAADLAGMLAAYAVIFDGDVPSSTFSIGGPMLNDIKGNTGNPPQGLSYSHNAFEGDSSVTRSDAYLDHGDAHSSNVTQFTTLYGLGMSNDRYTLDTLRQFAAANQYFSVQHNPYYYSALFSNTVFTYAAYNLLVNHFSNHSAVIPSGYLNGYNLKTFYGYTGVYPMFEWLPGQERIPNNWYTRPTNQQYTAASFFQDLGIGFQAYPNTFRLGGNINGVNSYAPVNVSQLTGGMYSEQAITNGTTNIACLLFAMQQQMVPQYRSMLGNQSSQAAQIVNQYIVPVANQYNSSCHLIKKYDGTVFNGYPGRNYNPTGPDLNY